MRKILLIGNGFDIYHKLPTKYTDFLFFAQNWAYFKRLNQNAGNTCKDIDGIEIRLGEKGSLIEQSIEDFAQYRDILSGDVYSLFDNNINSGWIQYFLELLQQREVGEKWIDFEQEIQNVLNYIEEYIDLISQDLAFINELASESVHLVIKVFFEKSPESFKSHNPMDSHKIEDTKKKVVKTLLEELDKLIACLRIYLRFFVERIKIKVYSEQIRELGEVDLLSFNYTNTFRMVYGEKQIKRCHLIHGETKQSNLVLGIADDAFPEINEYIRFHKYFQRIQKKTGLYYREWIYIPNSFASTFDNMPFDVHVMGHSLGESDKGVLQDFFENMYLNKIIIYYHSDEAYEDMIINIVKMFRKDFLIDNVASGKIVFEKLREPLME